MGTIKLSKWALGLIAIPIATIALGPIAATPIQLASPAHASVCDLYKHASRYDQATVLVDAQVLSNGIDKVVLIDSHCPRSYVRMTFAEILPFPREFRSLVDLLNENSLKDARRKKVFVSAVGVVHLSDDRHGAIVQIRRINRFNTGRVRYPRTP